MDILDSCLDNMGIETEDAEVTLEKISKEAEEAGFSIDGTKGIDDTQHELMFNITKEDRYQAVYEWLIPKAYENSSFDTERIRINLKEQYRRNPLYKIINFNKYIEACNYILSTIRMKRLPTCSYLIGAPNSFGKHSFVAESLITLRRQGFKVAPYISLSELAEIRNYNEQRLMNPFKYDNNKTTNYKFTNANKPEDYVKSPEIITGRYSYSEYINADCLFVYFSDVMSKNIESHALYQLLNIRGAKGLPTIVMISTSLVPYTSDSVLKEQVWDEILTDTEKELCYDRVYHVSCYKLKRSGLESKDETVEKDTGIVY